jgi:hypothetical protein
LLPPWTKFTTQAVFGWVTAVVEDQKYSFDAVRLVVQLHARMPHPGEHAVSNAGGTAGWKR